MWLANPWALSPHLKRRKIAGLHPSKLPLYTGEPNRMSIEILKRNDLIYFYVMSIGKPNLIFDCCHIVRLQFSK